MIKPYFILVLVFFISCQDRPESGSEFFTFQMTAEDKIESLDLSQIAAIEYVKLGGENQDFLVHNEPIACTDKHIVVYEPMSGDFFLFDQEGNPLTRFNHKGEGPGEYTIVTGVVCDETAGELFVYFMNKIEVYSLDGLHRRTLNLPEGKHLAELFDFGPEWLLAYDAHAVYKEAANLLPGHSARRVDEAVSLPSESSPFQLLSKTDGHVERTFPVAQNKEIKLVATMEMDGIGFSFPARTMRIVPLREGAILYNQESDTLFYLTHSLDLQPVAIRMPSVGATDPMRYLNGYLEVSNYQFFESVPLVVERGRFKPIYLCRDKRDGNTFRPQIYLPDFISKELFLSSSMNRKSSDSQVGYQVLPTEELLAALDEGRLKGSLKALASKMDEEDNYVLLRLRFKE